MEFEWDEEKAAANAEKHGVTFDQAKIAFDDSFFLVFEDPDHSAEEERFILFGVANEGSLLVVSYTERAAKVRLISAREATRHEREDYERFRRRT